MKNCGLVRLKEFVMAFLRHRPANIEGEWTEVFAGGIPEIEGPNVSHKFVIDYGRGQRELDITIHGTMFYDLAKAMMGVDPRQATAAFAAAISEEYSED